MASAKRVVLRWPQSSVAVLMNFLALHVTPRSFGKLYKRDSSNTARHAVGAGPGAFRPVRAVTGLDLELTGLLEPAGPGDGATADTGHGAFIPYIVTYIGAYNVTE